MADTTTTNYGLTKPEVGASEDTWGTKINTNLDTLDTTVDSIQGKSGAGVLKHTNNTKLATTSTGIDVTGTATMDGLTVQTTNGLNALLESSNSYQYLQFKNTDETNNYIGFVSDDFVVSPANNQKLIVTAEGSVGIGTSSPSANLEITQSGNNVGLLVSGGSYNYTAKFESSDAEANIIIEDSNSTNDGNMIGVVTNDMYFITAAAERMRISSAGNVGIGTSSPASGLELEGVGNATNVTLDNTTGSTGRSYSIRSGNTGNLDFYDNDATTARLVIDSSGNVGIGTSSPSASKFSSTPDGVLNVSGDKPVVYLTEEDETDSNVWMGLSNEVGIIGNTGTALAFRTGASTATERARIDSSGNLLVGQTSASSGTVGTSLRSDGRNFYCADGNYSGHFNRKTSDGAIVHFAKDDTIVGSIGTVSGDIRIGGLDDNHAAIRFAASSKAVLPVKNSDGDLSDNTTDLGASSARFKDLYLSGKANTGSITTDNANTQFNKISRTGAPALYVQQGDNTNDILQLRAGNGQAGTGSQHVTVTGAGNLLVGKTAVDNTSIGFRVDGSSGFSSFVRDGGEPLYLNRKTSDGDILKFAKNNSTVGIIGTASGDLVIGTGNTGLYFYDALRAIIPWNTSTNGTADNLIDLGTASNRFDDIYATNGTIQTSDFNEKQDIAELSDAEQRVAVAAKGLLRKFRWKDSVAEKGDEARTHFGIIAQDLQAAFAAEGLDAGDYAMFISSTWTDEETNEEKTRMGVRYSELLAFIIAAI